MRDRNGRDGFTLLEIMIAVAVLVIGILGVLAMFPIALKSGKETIQSTNGIIISQSVEQAIREGLAHRKGQSDDGKWTYFIFNHPGVKDPLPRKVDQARPGQDYYILLPDDDSDSRRTRRERRESAYERGKLFVFPESDGLSWVDVDDRALEDMESGISPNGGGNAARADDDKDDQTYVIALPDGTQEEIETFEVARTYSLDEAFFDMRPEDDQEESELSIGGDQRDPIRDYSFAFTMRRAYNDGSLGRDFAPRDRSLIPANELFEVEVLVYRSFRWNPDIDLKNEPILRTTFLVHK